MLYVATRRVDLIVGCTALFAGAIWWAATHYHYVEARITVWRDPFRDPYGAGYQAMQSLFSLAAGGLFGTGYHAGRPDFIPDVATDYVYAAYTEEWGAVGAIVLCLAFLALILRMLGRPAPTRSLCEVARDGLRRDARLSGRDHRRGRSAPVSPHRDHAALRLVRRQFARDEFLARRTGMGNLGRTSKERGVKGVSTAFWTIVLLGSTVSIAAGFVGGRSIGSAGALPVAESRPDDDGPPAPIRQGLLRRSLFGSHSLDAAGGADPYGDPEIAVAERPVASPHFDDGEDRAKIAVIVVDAGRAGPGLEPFAGSPLPLAMAVAPGDDDAHATVAIARRRGQDRRRRRLAGDARASRLASAGRCQRRDRVAR